MTTAQCRWTRNEKETLSFVTKNFYVLQARDAVFLQIHADPLDLSAGRISRSSGGLKSDVGRDGRRQMALDFHEFKARALLPLT